MIYKNIDSNWTQFGSDIDAPGSYDRSGKSVSISSDGSIVAVGAHGNSSDRGTTRIYKYSIKMRIKNYIKDKKK